MSYTKTILEINNDWLKIAEIEVGKNTINVKNLGVKKVDLENEQISKNLQDLLKDSKIKSKNLITYIPRHLLTVRNIELPSSDPEEIKKMVGLQIGKETPYSKDEIISDYHIIGSEKEGYSKVMLVIIRREIVKSYINLLRSINIHTEKIGLSSEGILNCYLLNTEEDEDKAIALCDIDSNFSDFCIVSNGNLVFTRSISLGAYQLLKDTGMWQSKFIEEIKRSINIYYNEEMGKDLSEIILSGSSVDFPGLESSIASDLSLPVNVVKPFKNIRVPENVKSMEEFIRCISFSSLIGIASEVKPAMIDLVPTETRIDEELEEKMKDLFMMGTIAFVIIVIIAGIFFKKMNDKEQILNKLDASLAKTETEANEIDLMKQKVNLVKKRQHMDRTALVIFNELYSIVPEEIYFSSIDFEKDNEVRLRGASNARSHVLKFGTTLENLKYFEEVVVKRTTKRNLKDKVIIDFEIICPIKRS